MKKRHIKKGNALKMTRDMRFHPGTSPTFAVEIVLIIAAESKKSSISLFAFYNALCGWTPRTHTHTLWTNSGNWFPQIFLQHSQLKCQKLISSCRRRLRNCLKRKICGKWGNSTTTWAWVQHRSSRLPVDRWSSMRRRSKRIYLSSLRCDFISWKKKQNKP